jgi:hypothetical protein
MNAPVEIIDSKELAARWKVPESWVRSYSRERCPKSERIPCLKFGHYRRYEWNSEPLQEWLQRHREGAAQ